MFAPSTSLGRGDKYRCCCSPCQGLSFLTSKYGILKILEMILCVVAATFVYDVQKSPDEPLLPNRVFFSFSTSLNTAMFNTLTFVIVYVCSERSFELVRASLFEIVINVMVLGALAYSTLLVAFKKNFFTNPLTFLEGRSNDTSETVLYVSLLFYKENWSDFKLWTFLFQYLGSFLILCYTSDIVLATFSYFRLARKKEKKQISIFKMWKTPLIFLYGVLKDTQWTSFINNVI